MAAEIQTTIDECADGTWEATLLIGSNFISRVHGDTFEDAARLLAGEIRGALALRTALHDPTSHGH